MATFMAKWSEQQAGQSGHIHLSLTRKSNGLSAFHDINADGGVGSVVDVGVTASPVPTHPAANTTRTAAAAPTPMFIAIPLDSPIQVTPVVPMDGIVVDADQPLVRLMLRLSEEIRIPIWILLFRLLVIRVIIRIILLIRILLPLYQWWW